MDLILLGIMIIFVLMVRRVEPVQDLAASKDFIFVALADHGVRVLNAAQTPGEPVEVGMYNTLGSALGVSVREKEDHLELYVADDDQGVEMFWVAEGGGLSHGWFYAEMNPARDVAVLEDFVWVARGQGGLWVLNIEDGKPGEKESWQVEDIPSAARVATFEDKLYVLDQAWNLYSVKLDKDEPAKSKASKAFPVGAPVNDFVVYGGLALMATREGGLILLDLNLPPDKAKIGEYKAIANLRSVAVYGSTVFVSAGEQGILALDIAARDNIVPIGKLEEIQIGQVESIHSPEQGGVAEPILRKINAQKILLAGGLLYYADEDSGVRVLEPHLKIEVQIADVLGGINSKESWAGDVVVSEREPATEDEKKKIYAFMAGGDHDLWVFDVTQPEKPQDLSYKIKAEDNVERLKGNTTAIAMQGNTLFLAYGEDGVQVLDASDPLNLTALKPVKIDGQTRALALQGKKTLFTVGNKGLKVIDVSDIRKAHVIGQEDKVSAQAEGLFAANNHVFVAAGEAGLQIVNVANPEIPTLLQTYPLEGQAHAVAAYAHYPVGNDQKKAADPQWFAYVANGDRGLAVLSLSDNMDATQLQTITFQEGRQVRDVTIQGERLFVTVDQDGLYIYDLSNSPAAPQQLDLVDTPGLASAVFPLNNYAYIADHNRGLRVIQIQKEPLDLREVGNFDMPTRAKDLAITQDGQYAFMVGDANGLWSLSLADPKNPIPVNLLEITGQPDSIEFNGPNQVYLGDGPRGFYIVNLNLSGSKTPTPEIAAHFTELKDVRRVKGSQGYAYVANGDGGVAIVSVQDLKKIKVESTFPTSGAAMSLDMDQEYVYIVTSQNKLDVGYIRKAGELDNQNPRTNLQRSLGNAMNITLAPERNQAYLADGNNGLVVVNVNQPMVADQPEKIPHFDTPGTLRDIAYTPYNLFLADGISGVDMIYVPEFWSFETGGQAYFTFDPSAEKAPQDCVPEAIAIAAIPRVIERKGEGEDEKIWMRHYAYVATDQCGLVTLEYTVSMELNQRGLYATPGEVGFKRVASDYGHVIFSPLKGLKKGGVTFLEIFKVSTLIIQGELGALDARVRETARLFAFGLFFVSAGLLIWLALLSVFVLPVQSLGAGTQRSQSRLQNLQRSPLNPQGRRPRLRPITGFFRRNLQHFQRSLQDFQRSLEDTQISDEEFQRSYQRFQSSTRKLQRKLQNIQGRQPRLQPGILNLLRRLQIFQNSVADFQRCIQDPHHSQEEFEHSLQLFRRNVQRFQDILRSYRDRHRPLRPILQRFERSLRDFQRSIEDPRRSRKWLWHSLLGFERSLLGFQGILQSYQRLVLYFRGFHGPAYRVRGGQVDTRPLGDKGASVALVDLSSAVTIEEYLAPRNMFISLFSRKPFKRRQRDGETPYQVRVAGPGLVFLKWFERVQAGADLRRQFRIRLQVEALTRDGIEVFSHVFTGFSIGEDPEILKVTYVGDEVAENLRVVTIRERSMPIPGNPERSRMVEKVTQLQNTLDEEDRREMHRFIQGTELGDEPEEPHHWLPFHFDEQRVFKAVVSRPRDVDDRLIKDWTELPAHVAAGIYRDLIHREMYDRLFEPKDPKDYPISELKATLAYLMRNQGILAYQYVEKKDGTPIEEGQFWDPDQVAFSGTQELRNPKPLRARGIRVIFAGFTELLPTHEEVGEVLTEFWQAEWQKETMIKRADHDLQALRVINLARSQAETDLVNTLAMILEGREHTQEALAFRILQALEAAATDPHTQSLLPRDTILILDRIQRMLLPPNVPPSED